MVWCHQKTVILKPNKPSTDDLFDCIHTDEEDLLQLCFNANIPQSVSVSKRRAPLELYLNSIRNGSILPGWSLRLEKSTISGTTISFVDHKVGTPPLLLAEEDLLGTKTPIGTDWLMLKRKQLSRGFTFPGTGPELEWKWMSKRLTATRKNLVCHLGSHRATRG